MKVCYDISASFLHGGTDNSACKVQLHLSCLLFLAVELQEESYTSELELRAGSDYSDEQSYCLEKHLPQGCAAQKGTEGAHGLFLCPLV